MAADEAGNGAHGSHLSDSDRSEELVDKDVERLQSVGRSLPADYLAVASNSIPFTLRVDAIDSNGPPDVVVDTIEAAGPGYLPAGSSERLAFNELAHAAANEIRNERTEAEDSDDDMDRPAEANQRRWLGIPKRLKG
jgi:hypothetical protein